jgi:bifunctional UDP-N-acetylglucosamine pyrophosphorylase/glucosamine-1-phosphate N-acetyltransferase
MASCAQLAALISEWKMKITPVVLAAGQSTRMNSNLTKVLHPLLGREMIWYGLETVQQATGARPVLVIGHEAEAIRRAIGSAAELVVQQPQRGTAHAVMQVEHLLRGQTDHVLVTYGDMPLLTQKTIRKIIQAHLDVHHHFTPVTLLTLFDPDSRGFGRVIRGPDGAVLSIVEEPQATPEQLAIQELNASVYCFTAEWLWDALHQIPLSPKGEYYLTDIVAVAVRSGYQVQALVAEDPAEAIGINNRVHLAEAEAQLRQRINRQWMLAGVTIIDPLSTYIEPTVRIGRDTVIWPNTYLHGATQVGEACALGPNTQVSDTQIGDRCKVSFSVLEKALLEDEVDIGPFAHLRSGAHLAQGVHMGNFGEVKNSYLGPGTKMGHFSYIGDATLGAKVNIGAGTITCNYDGKVKSHTDIGPGAFIGSDTMLVAPVKIGAGGITGAGAVVTKDVPADSLAVGVPARVIRRLISETA